jgi:ketosteroid isomerase-like protein
MRSAPLIASASLLGVILAPASAAPLSAAAAADPVQQKFRAFNRHDALAIQQLYAADARLHSPDYPDLAGNTAIADTYRRLFAAIPDARDEVTLLEAGAQRVYVQFVLRGHWSGDANKPVSVRIISVYRVVGDRIVEDDTYYDRKG